jgi:hypothetical protein
VVNNDDKILGTIVGILLGDVVGLIDGLMRGETEGSFVGEFVIGLIVGDLFVLLLLNPPLPETVGRKLVDSKVGS